MEAETRNYIQYYANLVLTGKFTVFFVDFPSNWRIFQFHGLVEHGHEARVHLQHNSNVVVHMYDRDYSGSNGRYKKNQKELERKRGRAYTFETNTVHYECVGRSMQRCYF